VRQHRVLLNSKFELVYVVLFYCSDQHVHQHLLVFSKLEPFLLLLLCLNGRINFFSLHLNYNYKNATREG